jgi:hypothetical protein
MTMERAELLGEPTGEAAGVRRRRHLVIVNALGTTAAALEEK